jgi:hypothetical protein
MSVDEQGVVILLGREKKQAGNFEALLPWLVAGAVVAREVVAITGEGVEFRNGAALEIIETLDKETGF